jgi:hypothetical protein
MNFRGKGKPHDAKRQTNPKHKPPEKQEKHTQTTTSRRWAITSNTGSHAGTDPGTHTTRKG